MIGSFGGSTTTKGNIAYAVFYAPGGTCRVGDEVTVQITVATKS